jgi:sigma-E factor negative regulatory protein RseA
MNETTTHEQLSALMDGELPRDELRFLLRRLEADGALAQRWSRYQIASAVIQRKAFGPAGGGFAAEVMARLDAEAVRQPAPLGRRVLRWAGGGAIAASVAIAALVATRPAPDRDVLPAAAADVVAATTQPAIPATPPAELHPVLPRQMMPSGFVDYAQQASFFEPIAPSYTPHYPTGQLVNGASEGFVPYVLVVGSRQPLEPQPGKAEAAQQRK